MRKLILVVLVLLGLSLAAAPAQAFWGHHCWRGGWGGCYGGWGGWGGCYRPWGGWCGYGGGWGGYGGYGPAYYYPAYNYPLINYSCYGYGCGLNYGTPVSVGYYTYLPTGYYNGNSNFAITALPQPRSPLLIGVNPQTLQKFLDLRGEVTPALALSERSLPKLSGRVSSLESRQRATRTLAEGDTLFAAQNFNSALQKYKLAASIAPDVAEAYWRQGHAFVATKNFGLAATAFKRAIAMSDDLGRGGFRLDDLYGGASIAKAAHLENLAELALSRTHDSDAYFLIGLFLNYDGQAARADKFFARASELAGISGGHIAVFLDPGETPPVVAAKPAPPAAPAAPTPGLFISKGAEI